MVYATASTKGSSAADPIDATPRFLAERKSATAGCWPPTRRLASAQRCCSRGRAGTRGGGRRGSRIGRFRGVSLRRPTAAPSRWKSSNRAEIRAVELAPARSPERQRRAACWPARVTRSASAFAAASSAPALHPRHALASELRAATTLSAGRWRAMARTMKVNVQQSTPRRHANRSRSTPRVPVQPRKQQRGGAPLGDTSTNFEKWCARAGRAPVLTRRARRRTHRGAAPPLDAHP